MVVLLMGTLVQLPRSSVNSRIRSAGGPPGEPYTSMLYVQRHLESPEVPDDISYALARRTIDIL